MESPTKANGDLKTVNMDNIGGHEHTSKEIEWMTRGPSSFSFKGKLLKDDIWTTLYNFFCLF